MNKLIKEVAPESINREFIKCLNGILELTNREVDILESLMVIESDMDSGKMKKDSLDSRDSRKEVMRITGVSGENLTRYTNTLKAKGILQTINGRCSLNKAIIPDVIGGKTVQITLILKVNAKV